MREHLYNHGGRGDKRWETSKGGRKSNRGGRALTGLCSDRGERYMEMTPWEGLL